MERKLATDVKKNSKAFWRYSASRTKSRAGIKNLLTNVGQLTTNNEEKAEVLNSFFSSFCTEDDFWPIQHPTGTYGGPIVEDFDISEDLASSGSGQQGISGNGRDTTVIQLAGQDDPTNSVQNARATAPGVRQHRVGAAQPGVPAPHRTCPAPSDQSGSGSRPPIVPRQTAIPVAAFPPLPTSTR